jgi:flavin-dependent dehydrogenase
VPFGYAWIFPKEKFLSVGMAGDAVKVKGSIKKHFNDFTASHDTLKGYDVEERCGWTVPIFYSGATTAVKGRMLLVGDNGHLVDPFLGEGIYYAIRTGKGAATAIADALKASSADFSSYQRWLEQEIYPEFKSAERLSDLVYNHPRLWYSIIEKDPSIMLRYYDVIRGEESCDSFYTWVHAKIRSKPWKVLRRWVESRFMQP